MLSDRKLSLSGMSPEQIAALCVQLGQPPYRANQVLDALYRSSAQAIDEITTLPSGFRKALSERAALLGSRVVEAVSSADGTEKLLIELGDGERIECVSIPEATRITCCISSQVGCGMNCMFCASGKGGLARNLTAGEIVEQALILFKRALAAGHWLAPHIVVMGMGEPLANYRNVIAAIRTLNTSWGLAIGARKFTISTIGPPAGIAQLAREKLQVNLAVSLHAPNDRVRNQLVPANRKVGIARLLTAAREFFVATHREVTFEYVLIEGINADPSAATELARRLKGLPCTVNLIPLNPVEGLKLSPPSTKQVQAFAQALRRAGINATIRRSRGSDVNAACGQLRVRAGGRG
jgi:23S rRNA (adenine2503-C2)-methyltransferase